MVFVGDKKYACETCIKGHRSSSCKHTDRPLFEIKKKGRPVTQCEHCRELRKTKQVHVKCSCEVKDDGDGPSTSSKGVKKLPASAAFPSGLPEALEASVALQRSTEGSPSGTSSPGTPAIPCTCKAGGGPCNCCSPRVPAAQSKKGKGRERAMSRSDDVTLQHDSEESVTRPAGLAAIANSGHHRPVLPRPSPSRQTTPSGPVHDPSQPPHGHSSRHQAHNELFYSPYGRAYDQAHGAELVAPEPRIPSHIPESTVASSVQSSSDEVTVPSPWSDHSTSDFPDFMPSLCGCGPNCACPGCIVHRGSAVRPSAHSCTNPNDCAACFECNFLSTAANIPPNTRLSEYTDAQYQSIDEWVRQLGTAPSGFTAGEDPVGFNLDQPTTSLQPYIPPEERDVRYDPALWQTYALWGSLQGQGVAQSECCGGRCQCGSGMCTCAADCCGCCAGCQCENCDHSGQVGQSPGSSKTLTFAESDIRDLCCGGGKPSFGQFQQPQAGPSSGPSFLSTSNAFAPNSQLRGDTLGGYESSLTVPRTVSRASSTSSHSSSQHSHSSHSSRDSIHHSPSPRDISAVQSCLSSMRDISTSSPQPPPPNHIPTAADQHRTLNSNYDFIL
ncbi:ACE1 transcription factor [Cristinia sonorae]|uniref:ACE1 transcription factor n=1 Tax=Cristinia sonorae TaxID=1940300 RepID=A0A8K0XP41_9AGAR|nr:ACE1 transcription factor [Cristinia sonorae]